MADSSLVTAINELGKEIVSLNKVVQRRTDAFARILWQLRVMAIFMLLCMVGLVINAGYGRHVAAQIQSATTGELAKKAQKRTQDLLIALVVEGDCRSRRALAFLPAPPDPTQPCSAQTPAEVYPG